MEFKPDEELYKITDTVVVSFGEVLKLIDKTIIRNEKSKLKIEEKLQSNPTDKVLLSKKQNVLKSNVHYMQLRLALMKQLQK